ncbi:MAG: acyl-CoA dehydrogenase family protein [Myxococcota bacterium]|nr:acyl-CoA dehydrogenase family protein [Myxococcota bacterium]
MDLRYSESDEKFRAELRAWLEREVPAYGPRPDHDVDDWDVRRAYDTGWQKRLHAGGYAGINWPREYGGCDLPLSEQLVYYEEIARARAPYVGVNFVGMLHGGPTLIAEGTEEQKKKYIAPIIDGDHVWCQGFSEPGAGSDLASLQARAVRVGDEYVINGHKIWTSFAQVADYCEMLVRTDVDAPKHRGISWLILPMDAPGIEIRPLKTMTGDSEFSEVFFNDTPVPVENLVGKENDGWRVTNVTLRFERGTAFTSEMYSLQAQLAQLVEVAKRVTRHDANAWDDRALRREIGHLKAELDALWAMLKLSVAEAAGNEGGMPGVGASAVKLFYTELYQRVSEVAMRLAGRAALSRGDVEDFPNDAFVAKYMNSLSLTIAAGSSQIQRNIISERILGLPRER